MEPPETAEDADMKQRCAKPATGQGQSEFVTQVIFMHCDHLGFKRPFKEVPYTHPCRLSK